MIGYELDGLSNEWSRRADASRKNIHEKIWNMYTCIHEKIWNMYTCIHEKICGYMEYVYMYT